MLDFLYRYLAVVQRVVDGDTICTNIDLGLHTRIHGENLRLARINAPEVRGETRPRGLAAKEYLSDMVTGKTVYIQTIKDVREKYGRYLCELWLERDGVWVNINDDLVLAGHAVYVEY